MFRPVRMVRLRAVLLDRDENAVLRSLGRLGAMHLSRTPAGPDTAPLSPPDHGAEIARIEDLLRRVQALRATLGADSTSAGEREPQDRELDEMEAQLAQWETRAQAWEKQRLRSEAQRASIAAVLGDVSPFQGMGLPFEQLGQSLFLHFATGLLPSERLSKLQDKLGDNVVLLPLPDQEGDQVRVVAVTSRKGRYALETALDQVGFQHQAPREPSEPSELIAAESLARREALGKEIADLRASLGAFGREIGPALDEMETSLGMEREILLARRQFPHTEVTVLISGWVPASEAAAVEAHIQELTRGCCVVEREGPDSLSDEEIPVLLRHPRLLRPFAMLVTGYGLPRYQELEPTLFVAISYVLMFGMMFGDVGHGAVLMVGGLVAILKGRNEKTRDVGVLLLFAAAAAAVFGVVYGSYFGIEHMKHYALWRDPLEGDPISLMVTAVGIGVVLISIGLVLNMINLFRRGDIVGGLLDKAGVAGAVLYWGVLVLLLKYATLREAGLAGLTVLLVVGLPFLLLTLKEPVRYALALRSGRTPEDGSWLMAGMESLIEAFEAVIGYMANTISFVRLAAYAMSHAAILAATFILAAEVKTIAYTGEALSIAVMIAGNAVAIFLEGVIVAVQALRLEYYEFFGKFFSGAGRAYQPFRFSSGDRGQS